MAQKGHDVFVVCPAQVFKNTITQNNGVTVYGIRSIHIPVYQNFRLLPLIFTKKSIHKIVQEVSPDIIHIQNNFLIGSGIYHRSVNIGAQKVAFHLEECGVFYLYSRNFCDYDASRPLF